MRKWLQAFKRSNIQTKIFILMSALYLLALAWTTAQAYVRLTYARSDFTDPILIKVRINEGAK